MVEFFYLFSDLFATFSENLKLKINRLKEEMSEEMSKVRDLILAMSNNPDGPDLCDVPLEFPSINLAKERRISTYGNRTRLDSEMSCHLDIPQQRLSLSFDKK